MGKHIDQYMHRIFCQILLASPSAAGAKSDSAEKKLRPPPPNRLQIPKVVAISRGIRPLPPIAIGRRRGLAARNKNGTSVHFQPPLLAMDSDCWRVDLSAGHDPALPPAMVSSRAKSVNYVRAF